jgi:hypothetical protein
MNKLIIEKGDYRAIWTALTDICKAYYLPYHSIKGASYPIIVNGYTISKIKYKTK